MVEVNSVRMPDVDCTDSSSTVVDERAQMLREEIVSERHPQSTRGVVEETSTNQIGGPKKRIVAGASTESNSCGRKIKEKSQQSDVT